MGKHLAATVSFRVAPEVKAALESAAERAGLTTGDFLRRRVELMFAQPQGEAADDLEPTHSYPDDCCKPQHRMPVEDFSRDVSGALDRLREEDIVIRLTREGNAVAEMWPVYREPPPELASVYWEADDAWEPLDLEWDALR
jgi:hypothetical protein